MTTFPYLENSGKFLGWTIKFQWALLALILLSSIVYKLQKKQERKNINNERRRIFGESLAASHDSS